MEYVHLVTLVLFGARSKEVSTPEQKCIGLPEQKYISDGGKKAPELGPLRNVRLGWDYPSACPGWPGVSGACSD
jgi:hypothetical protein